MEETYSARIQNILSLDAMEPHDCLRAVAAGCEEAIQQVIRKLEEIRTTFSEEDYFLFRTALSLYITGLDLSLTEEDKAIAGIVASCFDPVVITSIATEDSGD